MRLLGSASIVGILSGLAARALHAALEHGSEWLIGQYAEPENATVFPAFDPALLWLPALGCLTAGALAQWLGTAQSGHGTDLLVHAFHRDSGRMDLRNPTVNGIGAIGVIACGGSAGPEGPIAALGAGIGSTFGRLLGLSPHHCRILLIAGCGAGVGSIFQCPLGGALFAAGILYRDPDFETDAMAPALVSSVIGYSTYMLFPGYGASLLQGADTLRFETPLELIPYVLLGPICAAYCAVMSISLKIVEQRVVQRLHWPRWLTAGLGGMLTGVVACVFPQVVDGQYRFIQGALSGYEMLPFSTHTWWWWAALFAIVGLAKCIATALTVGGGAPAGVLGPAVFIGGTAGAFVGAGMAAIAPELVSDELRAALIPVGMAGVLSASMRTPLAAIVMVTEMTGSYGLIVPLMLVCVTSYICGRRWGLNNEQVRSAADSPAHAGDRLVHILESRRIRDLMDTEWPERVPPGATLGEIVGATQPGTRPVFAVMDDDEIKGVISLPDVERIMQEPGLAEVIVAADMMTTQLETVYPDDDAYYALNKMARGNHLVMPVIAPGTTRQLMGMLTRQHVYEAIHEQINAMREMLLREHAGLAAIDQEDQLHQLVMGVPASKKESVQRLFVPMSAVGQSLRESDFRRQYGIQVIGIEQPDGTLQCPPDPDHVLDTDHRLVAIVTR
jgi:CIC family chloride channel protein